MPTAPGPLPQGPTAPTSGGTNWGQIAQYGLPLVAAGINYLGQRDANTTNARLAREQMDFQERMSNTSWQRAVADMRKAGINPALAYSQGGAGTPGGATAQMQNAATAGTSSALQAMGQLQAMRATAAQIQNVQADTMKKGEETNLVSEQRRGVEINNAIQGVINEYQYQRAKVDPDNEGLITPMGMFMDRKEQRARVNQLSTSAANAAAQTDLLQLDKSRAKREAQMYDSALGRFVPWATSAGQVARTLGDFSRILRR